MATMSQAPEQCESSATDPSVRASVTHAAPDGGLARQVPPPPAAAAGTDRELRVPTHVLRVAALGLLLIGCFLVVRPFLSALLWSIVLTVSSWPLYARLTDALRGRRTVAALIMTLGTVLLFLAPFLIIGFSLADDVKQFAGGARRFLESPPLDPPAWVERVPLVGDNVRDAWQHLASDSKAVIASLRQYVEPVTAWLLGVSVAFAGGLVELALSIFIAFFLFRDGPAVGRRFVEAMEQLAGTEARQLADVAGRTVRGVVYGILGTALAQGIIAGIGFAIARIPGAGFLALMTFFLSVVPMGPPLVWVPVCIWLFSKGWVGWGIFMVVWGVLVSSVDNVIKPLIISQGSRMPFVLVLLGVVGGAIAYGFIGVFLGPTLLVVGFRLLEQWVAIRAAGKEAAAGAPLMTRPPLPLPDECRSSNV